ncbi:unnamed protein product [Ixodes persulcatus]
MARDRKVDDQLDFVMDDAEAEEAVDRTSADRRRWVGYLSRRRSSGRTGWKKQLRAYAARREGDGREDGGATGSRGRPQPKRRNCPEGK